MNKFGLRLLLIVFICMLTGCGNRGIPVIKQEVLDQKISVLMLSSKSLTASGSEAVSQALKSWREANGIAYEWIKDLNALDDAVTSKLKTKSYDYIYVVGNELFPSANETLKLGISSSKWTFLQSQPFADGNNLTLSDQALLLQVDTGQMEAMKNQWIQNLLSQNSTVEWITQTNRPVPSAWAPSEEADHIVFMDNNPQWFQQLTFQVRQHHASWIVFYSPAQSDQIQKAKTLGASVLDLASAFSADLNWTQILSNQLSMMTSQSWQKGTQNYNMQELKELKMK